MEYKDLGGSPVTVPDIPDGFSVFVGFLLELAILVVRVSDFTAAGFGCREPSVRVVLVTGGFVSGLFPDDPVVFVVFVGCFYMVAVLCADQLSVLVVAACATGAIRQDDPGPSSCFVVFVPGDVSVRVFCRGEVAVFVIGVGGGCASRLFDGDQLVAAVVGVLGFSAFCVFFPDDPAPRVVAALCFGSVGIDDFYAVAVAVVFVSGCVPFGVSDGGLQGEGVVCKTGDVPFFVRD